MIREIYFKADNYKFIAESGGNQNEITGLNKVNIFVGANNSGKSRFIRSLLMENYHKQVQSQANLGNMHDCNQILTSVRLKLTEIINIYKGKGTDLLNTTDITKILDGFNSAISSGDHKRNTDNLAILKQLIDNLNSNDAIRQEMNDVFKSEVFKLGEIPYATIIFKDFKAVYTPIMRGLRPLIRIDSENIEGSATPYSDSNCFEERVMFDHFLTPEAKKSWLTNMNAGITPNSVKEFFAQNYAFNIFTGLDLYKEIKMMLLGTHEERKFIREYEDFLSEKFFDKQSITLIPRISDDVLYFKMGDEEEHPIYNLGDGMQTIIIATFPAFQYRDESLLLFIEEPELTLHPGMQRKLLDAYCDFENTQVFITTHSNHLLDLTLDFNNMCSIFSFERKSDEEFTIKNVTPNKEVLELLGVRSSSVFLSNCVIWIEGISDRLYIRKFLELYNKYLLDNNEGSPSDVKIFEEDKHYSIVEYGGGNITHFNFFDPDTDELTINVDSIQKNSFIIADNDGVFLDTSTDSKKKKRLEVLSDKLGDLFFAEHIEIENLIPFHAYKVYFETLPKSTRKWEYDSIKTEEHEFISHLHDMKIGILLKDHFIKLIDVEDEPKYYKKENIECIGKNKVEFSQEMIQIIDQDDGITFDTLPKTTQELSKKLYDFIQSNNN